MDALSIIFTTIAGILLVLGVIGSFVPMLPGPPLAWIALLLSYFSKLNTIPLWWLIVTFVVTVIASVFDMIMPAKMTKSRGGSKVATLGCTIGIFVGLFLPPFGVLICPFAGAFIGECVNTKGDTKVSLKSAWGAFLGFLCGTGVKLFVVVIFIILYIVSFFMGQ